MSLVIVDTCVWVKHFRNSMPDLISLLGRGEVAAHPVVIGELAVGNLHQRVQTLADLRSLVRPAEASFEYTLDLVERQHLFGKGLSWGDVQLLAACELNNLRLWTLDQRLEVAAQSMSLAFG
jgi:predicted nucleic acid-binding protein